MALPFIVFVAFRPVIGLYGAVCLGILGGLSPGVIMWGRSLTDVFSLTLVVTSFGFTLAAWSPHHLSRALLLRLVVDWLLGLLTYQERTFSTFTCRATVHGHLGSCLSADGKIQNLEGRAVVGARRFTDSAAVACKECDGLWADSALYLATEYRQRLVESAHIH